MNDTSIITKARRIDLCKITSGGIGVLSPITHVAFGDGGLNASGNPISPSELQTSLMHEIARYPIDSVTYPVETTARYVVTIPSGDLDGAEISEAALVDGDGKLCAIKTMYKKKKDDGVIFSFTFDDEF